jgi:OmcA/MtrC family decaheme c-type cytochrome
VVGDGSGLSTERIEEIGTLVARISSATVAGAPVLEFTITAADGSPALAIDANALLFTAAKLVPPADGMGQRWQSYINRIQQSSASGPAALDFAVQATSERGSSGTLEELGDGKYRYRYATNLETVTTPIAVAYEPALTHRFGLEVRLSGEAEELAPDNPVIDIIPATGAVVRPARQIATTEQCAACHVRLGLHGGPRRSVEYCVTCHNPGTVDPDGDESVEMSYMVHSIHMGRERPLAYIVYGYGGSVHDYSDVGYPQSPLYCENCHAAGIGAEGGVWDSTANTAACGGCHADGVVKSGPDAGTGLYAYRYQHSFESAPVGDGLCVSCHAVGSSAGGNAQNHLKGDKLARVVAETSFRYEIISATETGPGQFPVVTFAVNDPSLGSRYDISTDPQFTSAGASLSLDLGWSTDDYFNEGSGAADAESGPPGQPVAMDLAYLQGNAVENADGSYTVTSPVAVFDGLEGDIAVTLEGHPVADLDGDGSFTDRVPVEGVVFFPGSPRRAVVSMERCADCHEYLAFHGSNRNNEPQQCVFCHSRDATDVRRREGAGITWAAPDPIDGLGEASLDFKYMIHALHAGDYVGYGFGNRQNDFTHVVWPQNEGRPSNCLACHEEGTYYPIQSRSTTVGSGAIRDDWRDDEAITPTAAACWSCHKAAPDSVAIPARSHIELAGGYIADGDPGTPEQFGKLLIEQGALLETCDVCHGPGKLADVARAHGIDE